MDREEIKLNMFLGKTISGEYVFINYAFRYKYGISGLTHSIFEFLTQDELDKRIEDYDWLELWKEAVYHGNCTDSYEEWKDEILYNGDAEMTVKDNSYSGEEWIEKAMKYANEKEGIDYEYSDFRGGGRLGKDSEYSDRNNYEYIDEENFNEFEKLLAEYEK